MMINVRETSPVLARLHHSIYKPSLSIDYNRRYLTDFPTPNKFSAWWKQIDAGDIAAAIEMTEEMEAKDAQLQDVASRRREALTALDWTIVPASKDASDEEMEVAAFVQGTLEQLPSFPVVLEHLAEAIGPGISVAELIWKRGRLVDIVSVPGHRLQGSLFNPTQIYVETEDNRYPGVAAVQPKFVTYTPSSRAGFPMRVTISRAQSYIWVIKHFLIASWSGYIETFGQPVRTASIEPGVQDDVKAEVKSMLENMGTEMYAMFPKGVDLQFLEAAKHNQPFEGMIDWIEAKQSILYLGQTLTTEQGNVGSLALGRVHENVRASITFSDVQKERRMIREQIIRPIVMFRWPGRDVLIPKFQRRIIEARQLDAERTDLDKIRLMRELGLPIDSSVIYERLGFPLPKDDGKDG